ncbi:hypothetical protein OPIT5_24595 [Opitutaceae bacterium TAV5]|nr:hypothetical protein OPIT5_24595 [Opitutaceae bacterium TAV5]
MIRAQVTNYEWASATDGDWETRTNWSPDPGSAAIGTNAATRFDRVTISKEVTVTRTGDIRFYTSGTPTGTKTGSFNALTLSGNARLDVTGDVQISSSSGGYTRNALVETGSILNIAGTLSTGVQNATGVTSRWDIRGSVTTANFAGQQSTSANDGVNGGYILNIDGGSFTVTETFDWRVTTGARTDLTGQINISGGGTVFINTMNEEWAFSSQQFVNFGDGTGSLTFGKTNWGEESLVRSLISSGHIRLDSSVQGQLDLADNGDTWTISVSTIPEPATVAVLAAAILLVYAATNRLRNPAHTS